MIEYRNNPKLPTVKFPEGWIGTPVDLDGRFMNLDHPFTASLLEVMRWQFQANPFKKQKKAERWRPHVNKDISWLTGSDDVIVWLGHSTFYIRINGIQMLTDPVFGDILSVKRQSEFPADPQDFRNLGYILLSHDHRDHLDKKSLNVLAKNNPETTYLTGLGMKDIVHAFTRSEKIEEAGWYQQFNTMQQSLNITFIPARHWSKRGLFDTNSRLWGGFVIEAKGKRIFFGGDSGYDIHYKQLGNVFGSFDYAILGIGAYEPAWFMGANHQSPADALKAFKDLNARYFIPMHYSTFDLSDEPLSQPLKDLYQASEATNLHDAVLIPSIGEVLAIDNPVKEVFNKPPLF